MKKFLTTMVVGVSAFSAVAVTPLWMRDVQISPDGQQIAFCYKGDVYKVSSKGGEAVRLTSQDSYESVPIWSPDSKHIAFSSDRFGNADIFVMDADGGAARRLTSNSFGEFADAFSPDGKYIYFSAGIQDPASSISFPGLFRELYRVPVSGGAFEQVLSTSAEMVSFFADGKRFVYQDNKGFEDQWRKHHTSSVTRDIWLYDGTTGKHLNLTNRAGEDRNPIVSADGKNIYFLSERDGGTMNVYSMPVDAPGSAKRLSSFKHHPVRFLSAATDGTLCYTYDGAIYIQPKDKKASLVNINIVRDDENFPKTLRFTSGATSACVSPDGKQVAFTVRGNVFVTSAEYTTTKQVTSTVESEAGVDFAPDNRSVTYASERDGMWNIYISKIKRPEDLNFPNATLIEEEAVFSDSKVDREHPMFSPDGKELAYIENECKLKVVNLETKKVREVTDGSLWYSSGFNYQWSPDGKWFTLEIIGNGHDPYSDVAIVKADGKSKPVNLTGSGYFSVQPRWVLDGNAVLFLTDRYGMRNHASWGSLSDVMLVFMNKDAYDKFRLSKEDYELLKELEKEQKKTAEAEKKDDEKDKKSKGKDDKKADDKEKKDEDEKLIDVQLDGIEDRIVRLTPNSSDIADAVVADEGGSLYYLSAIEDGYDLWKMDLREKSTSRLKKLGTGWASLQPTKDGSQIFVLGGSTMQKLSVGSDSMEGVSFLAEMKMDLSKEREYMFDHVCRQEARHFYKKDMHGVDWPMMTAAYRKFLPHIDNNADFAELLSELLGELNVSHTGGRYRAVSRGEATANLGLLYDMAYAGKGMRVDEVVTGGPFDRATTKVKKGVVIEKINGKELVGMGDFFAELTGLVGEKTLVSLFDPATGKRWDEVVKPVSNGYFDALLYKRWVKQRAADVERWSNGRLGYVHIESMSDPSFRTVYSDVLGKYNKREGIVIDVRYNGGGRLHEDIEVLFGGEKYLTQVYRGREACDMPSRRWNKPSIMVQCEACYSNAHGTPWVYKYKRMGKLVGMPVPGTMTSVSWETLQDPSLVFGTPVIGYRTAGGTYLENSQLEPDIRVENTPEAVAAGEDLQLKTAVMELLKEIDAQK